MLYYLKWDDGKSRGDKRLGGYWGAVEAKKPEAAEAVYKRYISKALAKNIGGSKKQAASILASNDFTVIQLPKGYLTDSGRPAPMLIFITAEEYLSNRVVRY